MAGYKCQEIYHDKSNPLENLDLVVDPGKNSAVIMKDGKIHKNTVK